MIVLAVDVEKQLGTFKVNVRFEASGGATALFGPSGSGKTSVVNMIAGLLKPDRGIISLDDTVLFNTDKNVGYMVYVVNGQYRATDLFPGHYDVTLRGTVGQLNWGLPQQTMKVDVAAGQTATADFAMRETALPPTYIGGMVWFCRFTRARFAPTSSMALPAQKFAAASGV